MRPHCCKKATLDNGIYAFMRPTTNRARRPLIGGSYVLTSRRFDLPTSQLRIRFLA